MQPSQPSASATSLYTDLYRDLAADLRARGLLGRRPGYYWAQMSMAVAGFAGIWVLVFAVGDSWWQLVPAVLLGVVVTQFGFLGHDAAHRQMFASAAWNEWTSRVLAGAFAGLSYGWWRDKHGRHHAAPNQEGRDPDIAPGVLAFTPAVVAGRRYTVTRWFTDHQGWFFFPLLAFEGVNLHWASIKTLAVPRRVAHQRLEALLVVLRLGGYAAVLLMVMSPAKAATFAAVQLAVFGVCLGGTFASNHKGMPIVPADMRVDFLRRQVLMSRNVRGGWLVDFAMGGLNYQIEHHLFPSMPRCHLRLAQPLVRAFCAAHDISYSEVGLFESYRIVVGYLNNVGLRARDPFSCPLAAQLR